MAGPNVTISGTGITIPDDKTDGKTQKVTPSGWKRRRFPAQCDCWDHMRARGETPTKDTASQHRDCNGVMYNVVTGKPHYKHNRDEKDSMQRKETEHVIKEGRK